jgi:hypothetical protein
MSAMGRKRQMLRHAHFYLKRGLRTFAAACMSERYADNAAVDTRMTNGGFSKPTFASENKGRQAPMVCFGRNSVCDVQT